VGDSDPTIRYQRLLMLLRVCARESDEEVPAERQGMEGQAGLG
jgi:hypothetical protein